MVPYEQYMQCVQVNGTENLVLTGPERVMGCMMALHVFQLCLRRSRGSLTTDVAKT